MQLNTLYGCIIKTRVLNSSCLQYFSGINCIYQADIRLFSQHNSVDCCTGSVNNAVQCKEYSAVWLYEVMQCTEFLKAEIMQSHNFAKYVRICANLGLMNANQEKLAHMLYIYQKFYTIFQFHISEHFDCANKFAFRKSGSAVLQNSATTE